MRTATSVGIGIAAYALVSSALARLSVWLRDGFGQGDLASFYFWTGLSAPALAVALLFVLRRADAAERSGRWGLLVGVSWGVGFGLGVTAVVIVFLGPWFGAFSFPVFFYWSGGAAAAFLAALSAATKAKGVMLAGWIPAAALGVFLAGERVSRPLDDLLIYFAPAASRGQVENVWNSLGSTAAPVVVRRGAADHNGRFAIRLAFVGSATGGTRRWVRRLTELAPGVVEVADISPYPRTGLREGFLPVRVGYDSVVQPQAVTTPK